MRGRLIVWLALAAAPAIEPTTYAQLAPQFERECPQPDAALADALERWRLVCATKVVLATSLAPFEHERVAALAVDRDGQVRGLVTQDEPAGAALYDGPIANAGSGGDSIFWGSWTNGAAQIHDGGGTTTRVNAGFPIRYVGGIPPNIYYREDLLAGRFGAGPLPTAGAGDYELLGAVEVLSTASTSGRVGYDADGNAIAPAAVSGARLHVDFAGRTAALEIEYAVRGNATTVTIPLRARNALTTTYEALECSGEPSYCATAELDFYGRQGAYAGVRFSASTMTALSEPVRVAARLQNVRSDGLLVFGRH